MKNSLSIGGRKQPPHAVASKIAVGRLAKIEARASRSFAVVGLGASAGGLSGLELAEKPWRMKSSLKIIIMSGYSLEMLLDNTRGGVAYTFLAKPFELRILAEAGSPLP
jgi:DNA-binding NtrC family response regulator